MASKPNKVSTPSTADMLKAATNFNFNLNRDLLFPGIDEEYNKAVKDFQKNIAAKGIIKTRKEFMLENVSEALVVASNDVFSKASGIDTPEIAKINTLYTKKYGITSIPLDLVHNVEIPLTENIDFADACSALLFHKEFIRVTILEHLAYTNSVVRLHPRYEDTTLILNNRLFPSSLEVKIVEAFEKEYFTDKGLAISRSYSTCDDESLIICLQHFYAFLIQGYAYHNLYLQGKLTGEEWFKEQLKAKAKTKSHKGNLLKYLKDTMTAVECANIGKSLEHHLIYYKIPISLDLETSGLDSHVDKIFCMSLQISDVLYGNRITSSTEEGIYEITPYHEITCPVKAKTKKYSSVSKLYRLPETACIETYSYGAPDNFEFNANASSNIKNPENYSLNLPVINTPFNSNSFITSISGLKHIYNLRNFYTETPFIFDWRELSIPEKEILKGILEEHNVIITGTNLKFDIKFLLKENFKLTSVYDLMVTELVCIAGASNMNSVVSLKEIWKKYTSIWDKHYMSAELYVARNPVASIFASSWNKAIKKQIDTFTQGYVYYSYAIEQILTLNRLNIFNTVVKSVLEDSIHNLCFCFKAKTTDSLLGMYYMGGGTSLKIFSMMYHTGITPYCFKVDDSHVLDGVTKDLHGDLTFNPGNVLDERINDVLFTCSIPNIFNVDLVGPTGLSATYIDDKLKNTYLDKSKGAQFAYKPLTDPLTVEEIVYAARDVRVIPFLIKQQIVNNLFVITKAAGVVDLENAFVYSLAKMEFDGVFLDMEKFDVIKDSVSTAQSDTNAEFQLVLEATLPNGKISAGKKILPVFVSYESMGGEIIKACNLNMSSPKQILEIFNQSGLELDNVSQESLALHRTVPIVEKYMEVKKIDSLKVKFIDTLQGYVHKATKCIHTDFWQVLSTGRISSSRPNIQQIPSKGNFAKDLRSCFTGDPSKDEVVVTTDYSNFELRILADASQEPVWLQVFNDDGDLHSIIAADLFSIPIENVKNPFPLKPTITYRDVIKTINFGLAYGMSEFKLAATINVTSQQALKIITSYFKKLPKLQKFLNEASLTANYGFSNTLPPFARFRFYDKRLVHAATSQKEASKIQGEYQRAAKNHVIQGTNADVLKLAVIMLNKYIDETHFPATVRMLVHDEIVSSVQREKAEEWKGIQENIMIQAAKTVLHTVPVKVESAVKDYWTK